jgi:hypothetical protein
MVVGAFVFVESIGNGWPAVLKAAIYVATIRFAAVHYHG